MLLSLSFLFFLSFWLPNLITGNLHLRVLQELLPNQEIHIISDRNFNDAIVEGPNNIVQSFITSATDVNSVNGLNMKNLQNSIERIFKATKNVAIVIDLNFETGIFDTLRYIGNSSEQLRTIHRVWVVVVWPTSMNTKEEIESIQNNEIFKESVQHFRLNSQLYFAFNLTSQNSGDVMKNYELAVYEAYLAGNHTIFHFMQNGSIYLDCNFCEGISLRRFNFHQRSLKVTAVNDSEINDDIHVYEDSNGTITYSKNGFSGSMHEVLQQLLNFTTEPMLSRGFGSYNPKSKRWEGSIGDVAEGKADIGMSITIFQPDRAEVVSFLPPADEHLINAFFTPIDEHPIRDIFAQPFKPLLWAAVITTWIVLASCMIMFSVVRKRYGMDMEDSYEDNSEDEKSEHDFTNDSFIWALGTACQQGWDEHPKAYSLRAIFISGSFTGVVAYAGYSAAIVSTLSLRIDPIQNPSQLLRSHLRVGIRGGFISNLLQQENTDDTMSHFYEKVRQSGRDEQYLNVSAGLERLLNHPYAFISTRDTIYDLMKMTTDDQVICGIKDLPVLKYGFPIGYPVPKFSPFREILRYAMIMIREPGILYRLRMKYGFKRRCLDFSNSAGYALGPNDVFTAFMILVAGVVASILILIAERLFSFQKQYTFIE